MKKKNRFKKVQLASGEPDITTSYVGEVAAGYIAAAIYSSTTLAKNLIEIHENVKKSLKLRKIDINNILQVAGCDFNHQGTIDQDERSLTPGDYKVNLELCKTEWLAGWEGLSMGNSRNGLEVPQEAADYILMRIALIVGKAIERNIWNGNSGLGGAPTDFNGFVKLNADNNAGNRVAGDGVAITPANVIAKIRLVLDAVSDDVSSQEDFTTYVAPNIWKAYNQKLGDNGWNNQFQAGEKPNNIDGYDLTLALGMPANHIIVGQKSNFHFGTMLMEDTVTARVIDMEPMDGSDNMRIIQKFKAGVEMGVLADVKWYNNAA